MKSERQENWNGMNWIRQEKRLAIYLRDGLACVYCGTGVEAGERMTLDHVKPVERGGSNDANNLVTACERCNSAKGLRSMWDFCQAAAAFINHGLTAEEIRSHIIKCAMAPIDIRGAKAMVAKRGSAAKVLNAIREAKQQ